MQRTQGCFLAPTLGGLQPPVIGAPGDVMPSTGPRRQVCTHAQTHLNKNKRNLLKTVGKRVGVDAGSDEAAELGSQEHLEAPPEEAASEDSRWPAAKTLGTVQVGSRGE